MPVPSPPHPAGEACRICGGELRQAFPGTVLGEVEVLYGICQSCHSLILPAPHWLDRAYGTHYSPDPDTGVLYRSGFLLRCIKRMKALGFLPKHFRSLDYGAGKGVLLRLLLDDGQDAWGYDAYPRPAFAEERVLQEIPAGPFELVTAIEVIEHTLDPVPTLKRMKNLLASNGVLALSTEFFDEARHGPGWHYLAPEHGQHITIFSSQGLRMASEQAGLRWIGSLPLNKQDFLHLLCPVERQVSSWSLFRLLQRHRSRERKANRDRFA